MSRVVAGEGRALFVQEVLLNGAHIDRCIEADEEGGFVKIYLVEETDHGSMILPTITIYGDVEIVWKDGKIACEDDEGLLITHAPEDTCEQCAELCNVCFSNPGDCDCEQF